MRHASKKRVQHSIFRWWFQTFFIFTPYLEKWSNLTDIFQLGWNHQLDIPFRKLARNPQKSIVCKGASRCQKGQFSASICCCIFTLPRMKPPQNENYKIPLPKKYGGYFLMRGDIPLFGYIFEIYCGKSPQKSIYLTTKKITNQISGTKSTGVFFLGEKNPWQKHARLTCKTTGCAFRSWRDVNDPKFRVDLAENPQGLGVEAQPEFVWTG